MSGSLGRVTERRGMSGILIIGYPSGNRSDNEPSSVFTKRAAEAGVGVVSKQNENLGKKSGRYGGGKRRKTKLQFASHGRATEPAGCSQIHSDMPHPPDSDLTLHHRASVML